MKLLVPGRAARLIGLLILSVSALVACTPDATTEIISPNLGSTLVEARANPYGEQTPTPEPVLIALADLTPEEINAGLPDDVAAALANADPANGELLALTNACIGCHNVDPSVEGTGPTWHNVGDTATMRVPGESPALYLYTSITAPNSYLVPNYAGNLMPANYAELLSAEDLADILAYLLAQSES